MRTSRHRTLPVILALLSCALWTAQARAQLSNVPSAEALQERVATARDSTELDDAARTRLVELYRQTIGNLDAVRQNEEAVDEYRAARETAPGEAAKIRARTEQKRATDPTDRLGITPRTGSEAIARKVEEEMANLTAVEAKLALLEARLEVEAQRPEIVRQQISTARTQIETLVAQARLPVDREQQPQLAEASRWASQTRLEAIQSDIMRLDQELLSYDARNELIAAQRDEAALNAARIRARLDALRLAGTQRRAEEAERAMSQAQAAMAGAYAREPLVRELAQDTLELVERLKAQTEELQSLAERERDRPNVADLEAAFRSARRKLELDDAGEPVGLAVLEQRRQFPSARAYEVERRVTSRALTGISLQLANSEEERRRLGDIPAYVDARIRDAGEEDLPDEARAQLEELAATRRALLDRVIANNNVLQRRLFDYDDALGRLEERTAAYDAFLAERLFWVRSTDPIDRDTLARLPGELARYLAPASWIDTVRELIGRLWRAPILLLVLLGALLLIWRRLHLKAAIIETGEQVGRIRQDSMTATFKGLGYSVLLASPAPLIFLTFGAALATSKYASVFASAVGDALVHTGRWLAFLTILLVIFMSKGVTERHFGWSGKTLASLRRQLNRFTAIGLPAFFIIRTSLAVDEPTTSGGTLTLIAFVVLMLALIMVVVGIAHPTRGVVAEPLAARSKGRWWRWRWVLFGAMLALPAVQIVLALMGFTYTIQQLTLRMFESIWFLTILWLFTELVRRWLMVTSRRLAYEEAVAARDAARARRAQEGDETQPTAEKTDEIGAESIDLVAMDSDSRRLLNAATLVIAIVGLGAIWDETLPAFSVLESIQLWSKTALVDGVEQLVPVTLQDLLLALIIALGGYIVASNLPSLLDIVLLKHGGMSSGGRYTVRTITQYVVTAIAVIVVLQLLGANASQLGWAAAALGVGIGFGLQEIVANFICGLILLFERPVRVGDIITVGDASGVVSKIRIRATTIRDWEQKELVIPNKELITGRLLNWTLSDSVTRIQLTIGVAYGSDTEKARALMLEAATESPFVLKEPAPFAHFELFADSTLNLTLRMFTGATADRLPATTDVNTRIDQKFKDAGIEIAFPQRDVHLFTADGKPPPEASQPAPPSDR